MSGGTRATATRIRQRAFLDGVEAGKIWKDAGGVVWCRMTRFELGMHQHVAGANKTRVAGAVLDLAHENEWVTLVGDKYEITEAGRRARKELEVAGIPGSD